MPIFSAAAGAAAAAAPQAAGALAGTAAGAVTGDGWFCSSFSMDSILSIASAFSILGKSGCDLPSGVPGASCPHRNPSRAIDPGCPDWPSSDHTLVVLSGKTGCVNAVAIRKTSAVVQRIV